MVLLDAGEFQVLEYYNHLLQVSVKHFLQLLYLNTTSGSRKRSLQLQPHFPSLTSPSVVKPKRLRLELGGIFLLTVKPVLPLQKSRVGVAMVLAQRMKYQVQCWWPRWAPDIPKWRADHERHGSGSTSLPLQMCRGWAHRRCNVSAWSGVHLHLAGRRWDWEQPSHVFLEGERPKPLLFCS